MTVRSTSALSRCALAGIAVASLAITPAWAQAPPPAADSPSAVQAGAQGNPRPKVGVAFGGGSAKGFAHIGFLRWLDEHRVPVDLAAGTSMGGLIGGAFAIGLSPDEVEEFVSGIDWDPVFLADTPFQYKAWRRKEDARRFPSQLEFGLRGGRLRSATGLNSGRGVDRIIDGLVLPYSRVADFDDLPTPFRLVAADTRTAQIVVLESGSLASAMRATMALPGIFPPVQLGDALLVDGGTLNNVPADIVRQMGADVVIAVDVGGGAEVADAEAAEAQTVPTMFGVMGAAISTMMRNSSSRALKEADLVISPKILPYGGLSWTASRELALRGYEAAEANRDALLRYQVDEATYTAWTAQRAARRITTTITPAFVEVVGGERARQRLTDRVVRDLMGKPVDPVQLTRVLQELSGLDRYETVRYAYLERDGQVGLRLELVPKSYGPPFLELGFELNNLSTSSFAADFRGRATFDGFLGGGSEFRLDFSLGSTRLLAAENFRPLWSTPLFLAPRAFVRNDPGYIVRDGEITSEYTLNRTGYGVDIGALVSNKAEVRFGYQQSNLQVDQRIGNLLAPERNGQEDVLGLQVTVDTQTSPMVPTRGIYMRARMERVLETADIVLGDGTRFDEIGPFNRAELNGSWFTRVGARGRGFVSGGAGSAFDAIPLEPYNFALGGPFRLGALVTGAVSGPKYLQLTTGYLHQFGQLPSLLGGPMFVGGWLETGSAFAKISDSYWNKNVSTGIILESIIGPVFGAVSVDVNGDLRYYISIGRLFR